MPDLALKFACPHCDQKLSYTKSQALTKLACQGCGELMRLPLPCGEHLVFKKSSEDSISFTADAFKDDDKYEIRYFDEKVYRHEALREALSESFAQVAKKENPHILNPFLLICNDEEVYSLTESHKKLDTIFDEERIDRDLAWKYSLQISQALASIHQDELIHGAFHPRNIILKTDAVQFTNTQSTAALFIFLNKIDLGFIAFPFPEYTAPESIANKKISKAADVYALGILLYKLFCLRSPFRKTKGVNQILEAHKNTPPIDPKSIYPTLDDGLCQNILRCLSKNPDNRPSASELHQNLNSIHSLDQAKIQAEITDAFSLNSEDTLEAPIPKNPQDSTGGALELKKKPPYFIFAGLLFLVFTIIFCLIYF